MTVHSKLQPYIDAWTHSIEAISELVAPLAEGEWNRASECPGWSVRDVVSHVIGFECEMLGEPRPIHSLPRDLYHVTDDLSRYIEVPVDVRRCHTAAEMTAELEYTIIRRSRQLRNESRPPHHGRGIPGLVAQLPRAPDDRVLQLGDHLRRSVMAADVDLDLLVALRLRLHVVEVARQRVDGPRIAEQLAVGAYDMRDDVAHRPAGARRRPVPLALRERCHQLGYRFHGVGPGIGVGLKAGVETHGRGPLERLGGGCLGT